MTRTTHHLSGGPDVLATVGALVCDRSEQIALQRGLQGVARVRFCDQVEALLRLCRSDWVRLVITEPSDSLGHETTSAIRAIRAGYPSVPVTIFCDLTPEHTRSLVALVHAGADDVIIRGVDDPAVIARGLLQRASVTRAGQLALEELSSGVAPAIRPIIAFCLENSADDLSVDQVAAAFGVGRRTLVNRLAIAGLSGPGTLVAWSRLLLATQLLEDPARSVDHVASALGFGSGTALRVMYKRYTGMRPTQIRERGGYRLVLSMMRSAMRLGGSVSAL